MHLQIHAKCRAPFARNVPNAIPEEENPQSGTEIVDRLSEKSRANPYSLHHRHRRPPPQARSSGDCEGWRQRSRSNRRGSISITTIDLIITPPPPPSSPPTPTSPEQPPSTGTAADIFLGTQGKGVGVGGHDDRVWQVIASNERGDRGNELVDGLPAGSTNSFQVLVFGRPGSLLHQSGEIIHFKTQLYRTQQPTPGLQPYARTMQAHTHTQSKGPPFKGGPDDPSTTSIKQGARPPQKKPAPTATMGGGSGAAFPAAAEGMAQNGAGGRPPPPQFSGRRSVSPQYTSSSGDPRLIAHLIKNYRAAAPGMLMRRPTALASPSPRAGRRLPLLARITYSAGRPADGARLIRHGCCGKADREGRRGRAGTAPLMRQG
ncbi:hypothetical protein C7M84_004764 [Penaeus vannamei]|uniref:Uncharacterized protein n=1 Tax=Penaeus vannamei TaxID=6689 RepID=A0A423TJL0_PENVA|nr:hypothetical protein C7M84_004764 [Penaeus vannamei]